MLRVCAGVDGHVMASRSAIAEAFGISEIAADPILHLQVRRFTPAGMEGTRRELDDVDRLLRSNDRA